MDPFKEIYSGQWKTLRDKYLQNWPFGVEGYCFLDMLVKNSGIKISFNISVFCLNGDLEKGMIAVSNVDTYHLYICPLSLDNLLEFEQALLNTTVIDWTKDIVIPSVMPEVLNIIDRVGDKLKMLVKCNGFVVKYLYNKDAPPFKNIEPPPLTHVGRLKIQDLELVDSTWTFHSLTSKQYFIRLMDNNLLYVLYSNYGTPFAWVGVDETGALSHLYTLDKCRRQGYGEFITKAAVNDLLSKGQNVLTYALADNFSPQKLFVKLGFHNLGLTSWVFMTKRLHSDAPSCSYCRVVDFRQ